MEAVEDAIFDRSISHMWVLHPCELTDSISMLGLSTVLRQRPGHSDSPRWFVRKKLIWGCRAGF